MKPSTRKLTIVAAIGAAVALAAVVVHPIRSAISQEVPMMGHAMTGHDQKHGMMQMHGQQMMQMHGGHTTRTGMAAPIMPGQDAFGAIQEIVRILEADPNTDWTQFNLQALRQHLIDMNAVTLKAEAGLGRNLRILSARSSPFMPGIA
jgi:hypothetical protein